MELLTAKGYVNFGQYGGHDDQLGCLRFDLAVTRGKGADGKWLPKEYIHLTCWDDSGLTDYIHDGDYMMMEYYVKPREKDGKTYQNATVKQIWVKPDALEKQETVYAEDDIPF